MDPDQRIKVQEGQNGRAGCSLRRARNLPGTVNCAVLQLGLRRNKKQVMKEKKVKFIFQFFLFLFIRNQGLDPDPDPDQGIRGIQLGWNEALPPA